MDGDAQLVLESTMSMIDTVLVLVVVSMVAIAGAVWAFWGIAHAVDFRLRGYRVERVQRTDDSIWRPGLTDCLYEEVFSGRHRRGFRILHEAIAGGEGYPAPCRIYIPNADRWDSRAPSWACGRREEIVTRIRDCLGAHTAFEDVDSIEGRLFADSLPSTDARARWWMLLPPHFLVVPLGVAGVGPWAAMQLLSGRWLVGGVVLIAWLAVIGALAILAIRHRFFIPGVVVAGVLTLILGVVVLLEL